MLIGHAAVAFAVKPWSKKIPFSVMLIAVILPDLLFGIFAIFGLEKAGEGTNGILYFSHGLFMAVLWSAAGAVVYLLFSKKARDGLIVGLLIFSHWILDFISHPMGFGKKLPPDLPLLFANSPKVGLGLYNSAVAAIVTDFGLLILGIIIYLKKTRARNRSGKLAVIAMCVFLIFILFPPVILPDNLMFLSTLVFLFFIPLGIWIDRTREIKDTPRMQA